MALQVAQKRLPDVILLDVTMPDMNGYEVCAKLQEQPSTASIPVIFATSLGSEHDKVRALQGICADHEVIKRKVAVLRWLIETKTTMSEGTHEEFGMTHEASGLWYHMNWSESRGRTRISSSGRCLSRSSITARITAPRFSGC